MLFKGLSAELADAVKTIANECKSHEKTCVGCPFWHGDGTVWQGCALNVYEGKTTRYPSEWEAVREN